jgi:4-nitrophenyl phosphatase
MTHVLENVSGLIIDMDGVLWHGSNPIDGLLEFFLVLRQKQIPFVLATNNASLTQQQYIDKLLSMGVTVSKDEILTSSMATATYLDKHQPLDKRRVFVIGEEGLRQPLSQLGFELTNTYDFSGADDCGFEEADLVVSGLDRTLSWNKLSTATLHLNAGAAFYATNSDTSLPTELGVVMGNGGTLAALQTVTGATPISIGKPEPILYQQALDVLGTNVESTIAIGDRLDTDILGAVNAGMRSIMVTTGISSPADIDQVSYSPSWIMKDILEIAEVLKNTEIVK